MRLEKYIDQVKRLPHSGRQIIGRLEQENIIVYQAFNSNIGKYALTHQHFGGPHYSFNRMSWIKPGFLWMMHRAGWATKENQQHILAISLPIVHFKTILNQATITSYDQDFFASPDEWKTELEKTEVRLQWDPDHDPYGYKVERKAIQIGMKGSVLKMFCTEWIIRIDDITDFARKEYEKILNNKLDDLDVPYEEILNIDDATIAKRIGLKRETL